VGEHSQGAVCSECTPTNAAALQHCEASDLRLRGMRGLSSTSVPGCLEATSSNCRLSVPPSPKCTVLARATLDGLTGILPARTPHMQALWMLAG
jgi:hypothetical protein